MKTANNDGIERSKERIRQTGEVFTPLPLIDEILGKLDQSLFTDPSKTFLDNSCGSGNFLVRVVAHKIANGSTAEEALSTTYGVDLMADNVSHCRARLLTNAFFAAELWKKRKPAPHLTVEQEREIGMFPDHDDFARKYNHIVNRNIVQHDALTYDYTFNEPDETTSTDAVQEKLKKMGLV